GTVVMQRRDTLRSATAEGHAETVPGPVVGAIAGQESVGGAATHDQHGARSAVEIGGDLEGSRNECRSIRRGGDRGRAVLALTTGSHRPAQSHQFGVARDNDVAATNTLQHDRCESRAEGRAAAELSCRGDVALGGDRQCREEIVLAAAALHCIQQGAVLVVACDECITATARLQHCGRTTRCKIRSAVEEAGDHDRSVDVDRYRSRLVVLGATDQVSPEAVAGVVESRDEDVATTLSGEHTTAAESAAATVADHDHTAVDRGGDRVGDFGVAAAERGDPGEFAGVAVARDENVLATLRGSAGGGDARVEIEGAGEPAAHDDVAADAGDGADLLVVDRPDAEGDV